MGKVYYRLKKDGKGLGGLREVRAVAQSPSMSL